MSARPYAEVIGDPISHSKSPLIHNFWLEKLGIDAEYRACHVKPEKLADYFAQRRADAAWRGCNVTIPHKIEALQFIDGLLPGYPDIGAINLIVPRAEGLWGGNTDCDGVAGPINDFHDRVLNFQAVPPRKVGIIGAGGAARAAVATLKALGWVREWRIAVRNVERGESLLQEFGIEGSVVEITDQALEGLDIVINASAMGMNASVESSLTLSGLDGGTIKPLVFDMVYSPHETGLIRAALKRDYEVIYGLDMLVAQASGAFEHFFHRKPPRGYSGELGQLLTQ
jgi:shikimate dehydrogenase